jgi:hypothetical protein
MDPDIQEVRSEIAQTREQISDTLAALEARVSDTAQAVKRTLNPLELARTHPWPALGVAIGAGVALSASGADRTAAAATVTAGRRAPGATVRAAKRASRKASAAAQRVVHHDGTGSGESATGATHDGAYLAAAGGARPAGPLGRAVGSLRDTLDARLADFVQQLWHSAIAPSAPPGTAPGARRTGA